MLRSVITLMIALVVLVILGYEFQRDTPFEKKCEAKNGVYLLTEKGQERCAKISEIFIPED